MITTRKSTGASPGPHYIIGLIYCSLISGFMSQIFQELNLLLVLIDLYTQVKTVGDPNYSPDRGEYEALEKKVQFGQMLGYLNAVVDGIIAITCLLELFSAL
jgi:hypothetical protein